MLTAKALYDWYERLKQSPDVVPTVVIPMTWPKRYSRKKRKMLNAKRSQKNQMYYVFIRTVT